MIIFYLILYLYLSAFSALPLSEMAKGQDKICTNNYADGQISLRSILRQLLNIPKNVALSKQLDKLIVPKEYTGYKILKVHALKNGLTGLYSSVSVNYCHEGSLSWSKEIPISHNNQYNIEWDMPICFLNPDFENTFINKNNTNSSIKNTKILKSIVELKSWVLETIKVSQSQTKHNLTLKELALSNPNHLNCFKLARRKKYAHQEVNIFLPNQFIGGLFQCNLQLDQKIDIIENNLDENLNWKFNKKKQYALSICSTNNSKPIMPLIGDKFEKYWTEYNGVNKKNNTVFINISKKVPFLYTPNIIYGLNKPYEHDANSEFYNSTTLEWVYSWKFQMLNKIKPQSDVNLGWYSEIDVNENYNYTSNDKNKLKKFTDYSFERLQNITSSSFFKELTFFEITLDNNKSPLIKLINIPKKLLLSSFSLQDKLTTILANNLFKDDIREIADQNNVLSLEAEVFDYHK
ncbi:hypothetical protein QEN19_000338 [Hanseniaspora menglaensis]